MIPPDVNNNLPDLAARAMVVQAFQKTMQRFLETQETVFRGVLSTRSRISTEATTRRLLVPAPKRPVAPVTVGRYVMRGEPASIPLPSPDHRLSGLYFVTGEAGAIRDAVLDGLRQQGALAEPVSTTWFRDIERWNATAEALRDRHGPVRGIVHLAGVAAETLPTTLDRWQTDNEETTKSLFLLLQSCAADLRAGGRCLALSSLDGSFGRHSGVWHGSPGSGAYSGLLKTAALEWPLFGAKAVDLDMTAPDFVRSVVLAELLSPDSAQEIGYRLGTRFVFAAVPELLPVEICQKAAPRVLVERCPVHAGATTILQFLGAAFPDARFVYLVRHPFAQGRATLGDLQSAKKLIRDHRQNDAQTPELDPQFAWFETQIAILEFLDARPKERQWHLRVEDLVAEPSEVLGDLCSWLGLAWSSDILSAMLAFENSPFYGPGPINAPSGYDPILRTLSPWLPLPAEPPLEGELPWRRRPVSLRNRWN